IRCDDGLISAHHHFARWSDKVRIVHFEDLHVPVVPLEWQLVANVLLRRPERSDGIAALLTSRGFDRPYVEALLADDDQGARTTARVREMLRIA
ncbi:MAG: hypothetical protein HYX50_04370, partial [Chloroflexi bacterium]|nr:hypothetical protein [Chloroflexota bacterium]